MWLVVLGKNQSRVGKDGIEIEGKKTFLRSLISMRDGKMFICVFDYFAIMFRHTEKVTFTLVMLMYA